MVNGQDTGYDTCQGGFLRRRKVVECPDQLPRTASCKAGGYCTTDADCTSHPYGHCDVGGGFSCQCMYGCRSDADCAAGSICLCGNPVGECVKSNCTTDADCGGHLCESYGQCGVDGFACQTASDECASQSDCPADLKCLYDGARHVCKIGGCGL